MELSQFSLEGKVALVTGGSLGIGRATAIALAKAGASVAIASRKQPELEVVANEIRDSGKRALAVATHIGRTDQLKGLVEKVVAEFGRIDILVNNAGSNPLYGPALELQENGWDAVMNLNLKGLFFLSQAVANVMKEHGGGKIINVASVRSFRVGVNQSAYSISKAGVMMATKVMAREWSQHNIRVNAIAPGIINTRLSSARWIVAPADKDETIKKIPLGRIGEPEEITGAMIFLASDASRYVTGVTLVVDGGFLLN
ncbi:MAG: glucose 1-dehydrogenase [Chloroflexi bacterium]|nr:glucose 1-dehydrogenase [Chloroflexota bacterium]